MQQDVESEVSAHISRCYNLYIPQALSGRLADALTGALIFLLIQWKKVAVPLISSLVRRALPASH